MQCQRCKKQQATVHLTDIVQGEKREKHLCEQCAVHEGIAVKPNVSINEVLNQFLVAQGTVHELAQMKCPDCGMSFVEFRSQGLLGCPKDYDVFGDVLAGMIERAQDGGTHHTGKQPGQLVEINPAQHERLQVQRALREAVEAEKYEEAARLRDRLAELDNR